jgi:hypothetical protein
MPQGDDEVKGAFAVRESVLAELVEDAYEDAEADAKHYGDSWEQQTPTFKSNWRKDIHDPEEEEENDRKRDERSNSGHNERGGVVLKSLKDSHVAGSRTKRSMRALWSGGI